MNYWIFKANQKHYDIEKHLAYHDRRVTWRVEDHKDAIKAGDVAFIWRTGAHPAIIGVMYIDSDPTIRKEFPHEFQFYKYSSAAAGMMVRGMFKEGRKEISHVILKRIKETSNLPIFKGNKSAAIAGGTNYQVTEEQANKLIELMN